MKVKYHSHSHSSKAVLYRILKPNKNKKNYSPIFLMSIVANVTKITFLPILYFGPSKTYLSSRQVFFSTPFFQKC